MASERNGGWRVGLRTKFIAVLAVLTVAVALVIIGIEQYRVRRTIIRQTVDQGFAIASTIASTSGYYVLFGLTDDLKKIVTDLHENPSVQYADFLSAEGKVLAATHPRVPPEIASRPLGRERSRVDIRGVGGEALHLFVIPFFESEADAANATARPKGFFRLVINERGAQATVRALAMANLGITALALAAAIGLAYLASRLIVVPILDLVSTAKLVAKGDLTQRADVASNDEIGDLGEAFNAMAANLERTMKSLLQAQAKLKNVVETVDSRSRTVIERVDEQRAIIDDTYHSIDKLNGGVKKITENVEALSASSEETSSSMLEMVASMEEVSRHTDTLFSSVEDTSSATHQMVSSINEVDQNVVYLSNFVTDTSSSMLEMSASIAQVEQNAARSYDLALAVADAAESGMKAVRETIEGMEQIRQSVVEANTVVTRLGERSEAIGKILNVIEDVAEQTNLLALNAAILAAQAGEYGKGFSVVAAEIRELSERTASSTRDIANLIRSVQEEVQNALRAMASGSRIVEEGVTLSHEAGKALNNILDSAAKASGMGREIASATREQAKGSETVTRAVERLQELVQQINAATRQQSQGSDHIMRAVESMREVAKYVRQAMVEQKSGSAMISSAAERMIDMIHEIFQVAANQSAESEKIVRTMEQVRAIAEGNRGSAAEMSDSIVLLNEAIRSLDEEVRKFRVRA
ncbi:MAG TPA: HAMP domain-containing methyl-accepting chemotaxis protein [Thermoanaerobaculia bacterium]|nr:HAMP domain-containing methyl-accepting chemotaxis protein [Thermoanaerobaculia bacterium]